MHANGRKEAKVGKSLFENIELDRAMKEFDHHGLQRV